MSRTDLLVLLDSALEDLYAVADCVPQVAHDLTGAAHALTEAIATLQRDTRSTAALAAANRAGLTAAAALESAIGSRAPLTFRADALNSAAAALEKLSALTSIAAATPTVPSRRSHLRLVPPA
jgi:hypothetical protein